MKFLRTLVFSPIRLIVFVLLFMMRLGRRIVRVIVGDVSWSAPAWPRAVARTVRRCPLRVAGVLVLALVGWYGWHWHQHRPKPVEPERVTFEVRAPAVTSYADSDGRSKVDIQPLELKFSRSAAALDLVGKTVAGGVKMEPSLKGEWQWADDHTLRFTPAMDWPVGAHVQADFDVARLFAPHVMLKDDRFEFDTASFMAQVVSSAFEQNLLDPASKQARIQLRFNYPVDPVALEKRIVLALRDRSGKTVKSLRYSVTYDEVKLNAWIHSEPLEIPRDPLTVQLEVDSGLVSTRGGNQTKDALRASVGVPGLYSLGVVGISPTLVDNDRFEPEQVLVMRTSGDVRTQDLAAHTKAWMLPRHKPGSGLSDEDPPYEWQVGEVDDGILRKAQPLALESVPTAEEYASMQSFRYRAEAGARIYVHIDAGMKSSGGYVLGEPMKTVLTVPEYPKLLRIMADGSLLSMSGSKRISIVSRNVRGMKLEIGRVVPEQVQSLVSFNEGSYSQPRLRWDFDEDHIVERFEMKRSFPAGDPGKAHYEGVDLSQYMKSGKRGIFLLHLSGFDPDLKTKQADTDAADDTQNADSLDEASSDGDDGGEGPQDTRLIVVTDLGMLVKRALDGSQDVFVQSIRTGRPVAGATVSVLAINGQTLFTQTTTADGIAHFPTFKGLAREKRPQLYLVQSGDDTSFLPVSASDRRLDYSRFDVGGERNAPNQGQLSAHLFSNRGLYRPGESIQMGIIVRAANWSRSPAGMPLQAEIVDPRGMTVKRQPVSVDASGFTELSYTPAESAPTGVWGVNLYIVKDGKPADEPIGSASVQVKEFMPDRMRVDAGFSQQAAEGWVKPDGVKGVVKAQNLFGTPAAGRRVSASLVLRPAWLAFRGWQDYRFVDPRRAQEGYSVALEDGMTDDSGHAEFDLDLKKYADATYQLYFEAKAYEQDGGRGVTAGARMMVSSNDWLVGYKSVDNLDYVQRGSPRAVRLIVIDPNTKAIALNDLRAQLVELRYVSILTKQDSGAYKYESRLKEVPVEERKLALPVAGLDYPLRTDQPGNYALLIRRADGREVNRVQYSVAGDANITRSLDRNAELQVNLSKHDFKPGENIEIAIRAPYAGSGLITIERDKVYAHVWFHANTTSSVQHIKVPAGFEGNGYINVQYIRDPSSDEIFTSPLSYGVAPFSVNLDARRSKINVDAPALVKPGEKIDFNITTSEPAKVVVFAVDEGILQVARYKLADPLQFFFRKRMLEVDTSQILDLILPDFEKIMSMAAPGGDADDAIGRQLNPFSRKHEKPVAYWSGIADVNGHARLSYTVPDSFNGKLRVMAVAVSPGRVGAFEGAVTVRGDFVLSPNTPATLAPGDEADISVGVANNLIGMGDKPMPVSVSVRSGPQLQVVGAVTQNIMLAPMHESVVTFRIKATQTPGPGELNFDIRHGGKSARKRVEVTVRPAAAYRTQLNAGRVDAGAKASVRDLRQMYDAHATREASVSTAPRVFAAGLGTYLEYADHDSSEQMLSALVPRILANDLLASAAPDAARTPVAKADVNAQFFDRLRARQNAQGGFGLWTATPDAEPFVSAYAMHVLIDARERGVIVPLDMMEAGNRYLQQLASNERLGSLDLLRQRAYAVYLLTRQGNVTTNHLAGVQKRLQEAYPKEWKDDLAAAWLAASYQLMRQDKDAAQLISAPQATLERKPSRNEAYSEGYFMDPLTRDASVLYLLAKHFPERARKLLPRVIENLSAPLELGRYDTLSAAMTILALDAYAQAGVSGLDKLAIIAWRANAMPKDISTVGGDSRRVAKWDSAVTRIEIVNGSALPAWWTTVQSGYDRNATGKAVSKGIEIAREYTATNGRPLDTITVGDEIDVHLKLRAIDADDVSNIAIVDLLPGGFDPVETPPVIDADASDDDRAGSSFGGDEQWRPRIGQPGSTFQPVHAEVREDRVVLYGTASSNVKEFVYRIRATNSGRFAVPPAFAESLYDRRIQAQSAGGATLDVARAR
ncbi:MULTISPECIES: MG2 domain-containing protein [Caballeronia]|uniref:alpha-2-macroglobulin family protein n=1 Tax=Caballeronia TaxID=1827195 RepID=UPI00158DB172|nr:MULTISPECIES: MG2 domain-containing protein [Caballeronia]MCI1042824.1 alpha-2-macroglobulin family protein [Caballeronia zhejiangensis]